MSAKAAQTTARNAMDLALVFAYGNDAATSGLVEGACRRRERRSKWWRPTSSPLVMTSDCSQLADASRRRSICGFGDASNPSAMISTVDRDEPGRARRRKADQVLAAAEDVIYVGISAILVIASGVLLVLAVQEMLDVFDGLGSDPVVEVLDTLLLLFIFVELLSAVRATVATRGLIAEPFLIVGIIASIKEIVVLSVKAADDIGGGAKFRDQLWEIAVLGVIVLLLGVTAWLLRLQEREPKEVSGS